MVSPPELLDLGLIPPRLHLGLSCEESQFVEGFVQQRDISGIEEGTLSDGGIDQAHGGIDDPGLLEAGKDHRFHVSDALGPDPFSESAKG